MKLVVIGGTGLVGSKLLNNLWKHGHEGCAANTNSCGSTREGKVPPMHTKNQNGVG